MVWCALAAVLFVVTFPAQAWAWGPITHLSHGAAVLADATILGAALQRLLTRHRLEYLYGCVGPDITQAKKYTRAQQAHCHSWRVGWAVLRRARTPAQKAFAHGYLTHLAGDVYSHNHFVPTQLIVSFRTRTLRHIYWEARFDAMQPAAQRDLVRELRGRQFLECDALVEEVVARTLFSFRTDKRIFDSFIAVHDIDRWHRIMRGLAERSRYGLAPDVVDRYNAVCHETIVDVLRYRRRSMCQSADPTGAAALTLARDVRRLLRTLERRRGALSPQIARHVQSLDDRVDLQPHGTLWPPRVPAGR